jgi:transcriptional regulator with XRE-family HTH domain
MVPVMSEAPTEWVSRTIRGKLAERRISGAELGRRLGWSQASTNRRLNAQTPMTVDDLVAVARVLEVPASSLLPEGVPA